MRSAYSRVGAADTGNMLLDSSVRLRRSVAVSLITVQIQQEAPQIRKYIITNRPITSEYVRCAKSRGAPQVWNKRVEPPWGLRVDAVALVGAEGLEMSFRVSAGTG